MTIPRTVTVSGPVRALAVLVAGCALAMSAGLGTGAQAATTTPTTPAASASKLTFTIGMLNDVDSLNPFTGIVAEAYEIWQVMYDSVSVYGAKDYTPTPSLATAVEHSADSKTWTYTIRSGVQWSDGVPLTAKDVAYTFNRIIKGTYEQTNYGNYVANITSVTAPNDTTVVMTTKVPSPIMEHQTLPILPEHTWSKIDQKAVKSFPNEVGVVGSGPFVLTERKTGQFVRLTANKHYWGGAPKIDELVYRVYANPDALAQALKKGEVDFADGLKANVWDSLKNTPGITTYAGRYPGFDELAFNTGAALADGTAIGDGNPALKDKRVRQALSYAIDRDTIVKRVLGGNGTVGDTIIPPIYADLHLTPSTPYSFDPAKANSLLDAAGYAKGADGLRRAPGSSKPLVLRLFTRQESQDSQQAGTFIQSWFKDVGVTVDLKVISEDSLTEKIGQGSFDLFEWGWVVEPDPDYQLSTMTCDKRSYKDGGQIYANLSDSFYCNKAFDALYTQQSGQTDPVARAATVRQAQQLVFDDAPYAVLYNYDDLQAYASKWAGFVPQPADRGVLLFQYGAWSYPNITLASLATKASASASASNSGGGSSSGLPLGAIGGGAGVVVVVGAAAFWVSRRRRDDADVE